MSNDISIKILQNKSFLLLTIKVMELQLALCLNEWASYLKIIRTKGEKSQGSSGNIFRVKDYFSPIGIDVYFMGKIIFWLRSYLYES